MNGLLNATFLEEIRFACGSQDTACYTCLSYIVFHMISVVNFAHEILYCICGSDL